MQQPETDISFRSYPLQTQKGLSLIELILAISITAIISVVMGQILVSGVDAYSFVMDRKDNMQEGRLAMMRIKKEMREIASKDSLTVATADSIRFFRRGGNLTSIASNGSNLLLNGNHLAENISDFTFSYYNDQRTLLTMPISSIFDIHQIKFELRMHVNGSEIYLFNEVKPRNF